MRQYVKKPPKVWAGEWNGEPVPGEESTTDGRRYFPGCFGQKHYLTPGCVILYRQNKDGEWKPCSAVPAEKFAEEWEAADGLQH